MAPLVEPALRTLISALRGDGPALRLPREVVAMALAKERPGCPYLLWSGVGALVGLGA